MRSFRTLIWTLKKSENRSNGRNYRIKCLKWKMWKIIKGKWLEALKWRMYSHELSNHFLWSWLVPTVFKKFSKLLQRFPKGFPQNFHTFCPKSEMDFPFKAKFLDNYGLVHIISSPFRKYLQLIQSFVVPHV